MTPDTIANVTTITTVVSAVGTAGAAIFAAVAAHYSKRTIGIMQLQHEESIRSGKKIHEESKALALQTTKSSIFLECLTQYLNIMTKEARAIQDNQMAYAYDAQRALIDLLWFEFHLWKKGHIDDEDFYAWLDARRRSFNADRPELKFDVSGLPSHLAKYKYVGINTDAESKQVIVSYKRMWEYLVSIHYYPTGDEYMRFMDEVHSEQGRDIKEIMEATRRSKTI